MKYFIGMVITVLLPGTALAAGDATKEDVKKLARAGISEETILAFLKANRPSFRPTAQDIVDLKEAGVTSKVLVYLLEPKAPAPPAPSPEVVRPVYVYSYRPAYDYAWPHFSYWTYYPHSYFGGYGYGDHYGYGLHGYGHHGFGGWHHGGGHGHR